MDQSSEEPKHSEENLVRINSSSKSDVELSENKDEMIEIESGIFVSHKEGDDEPKIGMIFSNEDEAYNFYYNYARRKGFSVRRDQYRRLADGSISKRLFVCSKEGHRRKREPGHVSKVDRLETRTGCPAMIKFNIEKDAWVLSHFVREHNHGMVTPEKQDRIRSHRHVNEAHGALIDTMDNAGIRPSNIYSDFVEEPDGAQNVGFVKSDYDNFLVKKRIQTLEAGDAQSVMNHFKRMQANDPSFFYAVQVDSENRMTNFFWRDGRSKIDYNYFGDVVIFDTTYRTDKYNMVCAPFSGVNHHRQNVLFGCAFLLAETIESFIWLFESFLEAMGRRQPRTIFTGQCQAMANAIEKVFPEAQHRLCLWHIGQNATKHIGHYYGIPGFRNHFNHCIYECETEQEFEEKWDQLLREYDLLENRWLKELHKLRAKWCASQDYFSAGMKSTQISESMNGVFRKVMSKTMSLTKLVVQYENVAEQMRQAELLEDFRCNQGASPRVGKLSGMAKQAATIYTHAIFQVFHEELCECLSVVIEEIDNDGTSYTYKLIKDDDKKESFVKFNASNCMVECSCKMFESMGLLCLHTLRVYNANNIFQIPPQYILKRWTKCAKDGLVMEDNGNEMNGKARKTISLRMSQLMHKAVQFATKGALADKMTKMAEEILEHGLISLENALKESKVEDALIGKEVDTNNVDDIGDKDTLPSSSSQLERRFKKNKTEVEHASIKASPNKPLQSKKDLQGKKSGRSKGFNNANILPKPPTVSNHLFSPAIVPGLQSCVTSNMPGMGCMPMRPLSEGSFPHWIGHHSLQDSQTPQACTNVNMNGQLHQFNQESSSSWIFSRPSLQDASLSRGVITDFNGQLTQSSQFEKS